VQSDFLKQRELLLENQNYSVSLRQANAPSMALDGECRITMWNRRLVAITGQVIPVSGCRRKITHARRRLLAPQTEESVKGRSIFDPAISSMSADGPAAHAVRELLRGREEECIQVRSSVATAHTCVH
jgi:hypothetical protein